MTPRSCVIANRHPRLRVDRASVRRAIAVLDAAHAGFNSEPGTPPPAGELSVAFLTDDALAALHGRFLGDPTTTDVITFAADPALGTGGEICVSADTAARCARERQGDPAAELALYLVHGWLHLAGHDDREPRRKRAMRRAEARALRLLADAAALPRFGWRR
ncbi:MAG: rRNA maturation RNase YbeY [Verrucomicrobia bacterium]|nr:rRNA maturation RNase YbeY [Verrucomicrobiota bacterium]